MKRVCLAILRLYQCTSPYRPACCRFWPSCSSYAYQAIERHGLVVGLCLAVCRLAKCHPLHDGGVDMVPEKVNFTGAFVRGVES